MHSSGALKRLDPREWERGLFVSHTSMDSALSSSMPSASTSHPPVSNSPIVRNSKGRGRPSSSSTSSVASAAKGVNTSAASLSQDLKAVVFHPEKGQWCHAACALWIPETSLVETEMCISTGKSGEGEGVISASLHHTQKRQEKVGKKRRSHDGASSLSTRSSLTTTLWQQRIAEKAKEEEEAKAILSTVTTSTVVRGLRRVHKRRRSLVCFLCKKGGPAYGACVQCRERTCW